MMQLIEKNGGRQRTRTFDLSRVRQGTNGRPTRNQRLTGVQRGIARHPRAWSGVFCATICATVLCILLSQSLASAQTKTYAVPFHTVNGMILLDGQINHKPAVLLLDTGAEFSIVSMLAAGVSPAQLHPLTGNRTTGANGDYVRGTVDLTLSHRTFLSREVLVMDLSDVSKRMGVQVDGFIGEDVLREFQGVHIDYKAQTVTLEN